MFGIAKNLSLSLSLTHTHRDGRRQDTAHRCELAGKNSRFSPQTEATAAQLGALATAKRARGRDWARGPGVRDAVGVGWGCSAPARRSNKPVLPAVSEKLSKTLRSSRIRRRPAASMVAEPVPMVFKTGSSAGARRRSRSRLQVSCRARAYRRRHPLRASGKVKQGKITNEDVLRREVPWSAFKARSG